MTTACNTFETGRKPTYEIYARAGKKIVYAQVNEKLTKDKLKIIDFRKKGMQLGGITKTPQNKIYCSIYRKANGDKMGKEIAIINNGKIDKYIELEKYGPNEFINDLDRKKTYTMMAAQPKVYNPDGTPFTIIDSEKDQVIKQFNLKGFFSDYDFLDEKIYVAVYGAEGLGYEGLADSYIASIDRDTQEIEIITKEGLDFVPTDLKINSKGEIYLVSGINPIKDGINEPRITVIKNDGTFIKDMAIEPWAVGLIIDSRGIAYINHIGKVDLGDFSGDTITVYDTNTDDIVGKITGFNGASSMELIDNYLFVSNYQSGIISVVDTNKNSVIANIDLSVQRITELQVMKHI